MQRSSRFARLIHQLEDPGAGELVGCEPAVAVPVELPETFLDPATAPRAACGGRALALRPRVLTMPLRGHQLRVPRGPGVVEFLELGGFLVGEISRLADVFGEVVELRLWIGACLDELPVAAADGVLVVEPPAKRVVRLAGFFAGQVG